MPWTAANTIPQGTIHNKNGTDDDDTSSSLEATIARLSSSYNVAMECVGAMHEVSRHHGNNDQDCNIDEVHQVLRKTARTAREAFEGILCDPLVVRLVPGVYSILRMLKEEKNNNCCSNGEKYGRGFVQSLLMQWTTNQDLYEEKGGCRHDRHDGLCKIVYLSLVNYADLLMGCSPSVFKDASASCGIMKPYRAAVKVLSQCKSKSLFLDSNEDDNAKDVIVRKLVFVSYCDAAQVDASDPTLWLRAASAARALSLSAFCSSCEESGDHSMFELKSVLRRMERHCLERGSTCIGDGRDATHPRNRTIQRALRHFHIEDSQAGSFKFEEKDQEIDFSRYFYDETQFRRKQQIHVIEMVRCSWVSLGRSLIRACNRGIEIYMRNEDASFVGRSVGFLICRLLCYISICSYLFLSEFYNISISRRSFVFTTLARVIAYFIKQNYFVSQRVVSSTQRGY